MLFRSASALEFKCLVDRLPADTPFIPGRPKLLHESACYAEAWSVLQQAITQNDQAPESVGFKRLVTLPVVGVIADQTADTPANYCQLFASVTAAIAQFALELVDDRSSGSEHGGSLEISARFNGKVDVAGEKIKGEIDAVHGAASEKVAGRTLRHDQSLVESLMLQAFDPSLRRAPRSAAYKEGARAYLAFCLSGAERACAYETGSTSFDAYHAGIDEGRAIWTRHQAKAAQ